jgi:signal transduction histidine kinase
MIAVAVIFLCLFPLFFFSAGGYHSGMPVFFVFAVVFTMFMLEGKRAVVFSSAEILLYIAICVIAYVRPETVNFFETEQEIFIDVIIAFISVNIVLGVCLFMHFKLYIEQQRKLDEQNAELDKQNALLAQSNRTKQQFLANASHEMRTPLTIISGNVQMALRLLKEMDSAVKDPDADKLLKNAQSEIMRLSRMVGGMLTLASISESVEREKTDLSALLRSAVEMLWIVVQKRGNTLEAEIDDGMMVFGDADLLSQVIMNLIQNAHAHTENDLISLDAVRDVSNIFVTVSDNGVGISPELLPNVFERGVSGKGEGGTGYGLFLCKTVVESHGGEIDIESEPGKGTTVRFTIPVYEGQVGGGEA